jgi:peptidyl-prolyl cis-trans isomerase C
MEWIVMKGTVWLVAGTALVSSGYTAFAQQGSASPPAAVVSASNTNAVAATVNGQPISENAVRRALKRFAPEQRADARPAILDHLINNSLLDQYLEQQAVTVDRKEVDAKLQQMRDDLKRNDSTLDQLLRDLMATEQELRSVIEAQLRWDKYVEKQATDENLVKLFNAEREMFDGTMVRARHILLSPAADDSKAEEKAKADLLRFKKEIEEKVAKDLATIQAQPDDLARDIARHKLLEDAFSDYARKFSACPSKELGGDVDWFPRGGHMVEAFSKAAFALKPWQMSDVVKSPFGLHLILATDRKAGPETKFEDVKAEVKDVFCTQLRERICVAMRGTAKISITSPSTK